jgi:hypothetical protein
MLKSNRVQKLRDKFTFFDKLSQGIGNKGIRDRVRYKMKIRICEEDDKKHNQSVEKFQKEEPVMTDKKKLSDEVYVTQQER